MGSLGSSAPHDIILFRIDYRRGKSNQAADALSSPGAIVRVEADTLHLSNRSISAH